jgi:hypothetical protein
LAGVQDNHQNQFNSPTQFFFLINRIIFLGHFQIPCGSALKPKSGPNYTLLKYENLLVNHWKCFLGSDYFPSFDAFHLKIA